MSKRDLDRADALAVLAAKGNFERRQDLCGGALVVKGTRVPVRTLLASLAEGSSFSDILADFSTVSASALSAVVAFSAASSAGAIKA